MCERDENEVLRGLVTAVSRAAAGQDDSAGFVQALQRAVERLPGARVAFIHRDAAWVRTAFSGAEMDAAAVQGALCAASEEFSGQGDEAELRYLVEDHLRLSGVKPAYEDEPSG